MISLIGAPGKDGVDGEDGSDGVDGSDGEDGKSAYELAVENGFEGTVEEWLVSLIGEAGKDGVDGEDGNNGANGADGNGIESIIATKNNGVTTIIIKFTDPTLEDFVFTVTDGEQGIQGEKGDKGDTGAQGEKGDKGDTGAQGEKGDAGRGIKRLWVDDNLHLWVEYDDGSEPVDLGYVGVTTTDPEPDPDPIITEPTIVVSSANASAGATNVEITVALKNNPGVTSMLMQIEFDDNCSVTIDVRPKSKKRIEKVIEFC